MALFKVATREKGKEKLGVRKMGKEKLKDKCFEVNVTIGIRGCHIDPRCLVLIEEFICKYYIVTICTIERGGALYHMHLQMVVKVVISSIIAFNKAIKTRIKKKDWVGYCKALHG